MSTQPLRPQRSCNDSNSSSNCNNNNRSRPRLKSDAYKVVSNVGAAHKRPHSVDAEFLQQLERMGLSQSMPPFTTVSTKTG